MYKGESREERGGVYRRSEWVGGRGVGQDGRYRYIQVQVHTHTHTHTRIYI